jgi:hypothetical protein
MKALKEYRLNICESEDQNISEEMKALKKTGSTFMKEAQNVSKETKALKE